MDQMAASKGTDAGSSLISPLIATDLPQTPTWKKSFSRYSDYEADSYPAEVTAKKPFKTPFYLKK